MEFLIYYKEFDGNVKWEVLQKSQQAEGKTLRNGVHPQKRGADSGYASPK